VSRNAKLQLLVLALAGWIFPVAAADFFSPLQTNAAVRVVQVDGHDLQSAYLADDGRVADAFDAGLKALTHFANVSEAWRSLVQTNDTLGIKVFSQPGALCGTRPAVVAAIVRGLLAAGLPPGQIVIWDKHAADLRAAGFFKLAAQLGVRAAGAAEAGYDEKSFYLPESPVVGSLVWGDSEFGKKGAGVGKKSYVSKLVSQQLTKIISVVPLMDENDAGVCGHLFSLALGSVDNTRRFEGDSDRLAMALPEIYALPSVGDRVVLHVTDALLAQAQGGPASFIQFSSVLNQLWLGHDPVALDTLALRELGRERKNAGLPQPHCSFQIYTNAVLLELGVNDPTRIQVEKVK
jgi:Domain of unknown function (DUF362)